MMSEEEFADKLKAFDNHWCPMPRAKAALEEVEAQFRYGQGPGGATALLLLGESRVGKTHLLEHFLGQHPPVKGEERDLYPVIKVDAPHQESPKWLSHRILKEMNYPRPDKAAANSLSEDIIRFSQVVQTRMIIIDEVHQLVTEKNNRPTELRRAVSLLKDILNHGGISLVLSGTANAAVFSNYNTEFGERVSVHRLPPFEWANKAERKEFRGYVVSALEKLPLPVSKDIGELSLSARLFVAADGYVGRVHRLLRDAAIRARFKQERVVRLETLSECFERTRKGQNFDLNPFAVKADDVQAAFDLM